MPNYRLTHAAKSDLLEIWNYTVETWGEKQTEKYLLDIETKLEQLAANPELGRQRPEIRPGYYSFPDRAAGPPRRFFVSTVPSFDGKPGLTAPVSEIGHSLLDIGN